MQMRQRRERLRELAREVATAVSTPAMYTVIEWRDARNAKCLEPPERLTAQTALAPAPRLASLRQ